MIICYSNRSTPPGARTRVLKRIEVLLTVWQVRRHGQPGDRDRNALLTTLTSDLGDPADSRPQSREQAGKLGRSNARTRCSSLTAWKIGTPLSNSHSPLLRLSNGDPAGPATGGAQWGGSGAKRNRQPATRVPDPPRPISAARLWLDTPTRRC